MQGLFKADAGESPQYAQLFFYDPAYPADVQARRNPEKWNITQRRFEYFHLDLDIRRYMTNGRGKHTGRSRCRSPEIPSPPSIYSQRYEFQLSCYQVVKRGVPLPSSEHTIVVLCGREGLKQA